MGIRNANKCNKPGQHLEENGGTGACIQLPDRHIPFNMRIESKWAAALVSFVMMHLILSADHVAYRPLVLLASLSQSRRTFRRSTVQEMVAPAALALVGELDLVAEMPAEEAPGRGT